MSPRPRKHLDSHSRKFEIRFAIAFRAAAEKKSLTTAPELNDFLADKGVSVSLAAVKKWLNGEAVPRPQLLERIGKALGSKDYRDLLPEPI